MGQGISGHTYIYHNGSKYLVTQTTNHTISITGVPNSVCQKIDDKGNLIKERFYDSNGNPIVDIDYTNHGNPKKHPNVPHKHLWDCSDPKNPIRGDADD